MVIPLILVAAGAVAAPDTKAVAKQLFDRDPTVVTRAIQTLGASGKPEAVAPLCTVLEDASPTLRGEAAQALGRLRLQKAQACLTGAKGDADARVQKSVNEALSLGATDRATKFLFLEPVANVGKSLTRAQLEGIEATFRTNLGSYRGSSLSYPSESVGDAAAFAKARKLKAMSLKLTLTVKEDSLMGEILVTTFPEKSLRASLHVTGSGGDLEDLIAAVIPKVIDDTAEELEIK